MLQRQEEERQQNHASFSNQERLRERDQDRDPASPNYSETNEGKFKVMQLGFLSYSFFGTCLG